MTSLFMLLNGTPVALGVLTSTGTSVTAGHHRVDVHLQREAAATR